MSDVEENTLPEWTDQHVGVLGSGLMGKQLALFFLAQGWRVTVWNHARRDDFEKKFQHLLKLEKRRKNVPADTTLDHLTYTDDLNDLAECALVIEVITENEAAKQELLKRLKLRPDAVLGTMTSSKSVTALGNALKDPSRFLGIHFFNPVMDTQLVEVVRGEYTEESVAESVQRLLESFGRHPVVIPESPGYVVNRLLFPMINEAIHLVSAGVGEPETVDACMKLGANHPVGPLELADRIGLDVCFSILDTLATETGESKYQPAPLLTKYVRAGRLGRKSGRGFYTYRKV